MNCTLDCTLDFTFVPDIQKPILKFPLKTLNSSIADRNVADVVNVPPSPFENYIINGARYYEQNGGRVKPHIDVARDGISTHTMIFYLEDCDGDLVFETGERFTPQKNAVVLFPKNRMHWVEEFYGKRMLIVCDSSRRQLV